jgi:hypothetical protein
LYVRQQAVEVGVLQVSSRVFHSSSSRDGRY